MLAQNFKTADDLGITDKQKDALIKTLVLLETGKLRHAPIDHRNVNLGNEGFAGNFNMHTWGRIQDCGTIACIGGTAELVGDVTFAGWANNAPLLDLFEPNAVSPRRWQDITPAQAATALRSYLTTGHARWDLAVSPLISGMGKP